MDEARRRAYLGAMQVDSWLPRTVLPFAAPSRAELLAFLPEPELEAPVPAVGAKPAAPAVTPGPVPATKPSMPRPALKAVEAKPAAPAPVEPAPAVEAPVAAPVPRFALQLLRAGSCLLVVELPTGEPFQSRDPAYILLKDILRAARLPDRPQLVGDGEPIRWPLVNPGSLDQGAAAARDYVQGVIHAEREHAGFSCLWLIGSPALRFAGELDAEQFNREVQVEGLGTAVAMPGLEQLMEQPSLKPELWRALCRSMTRWVSEHE